MLNIKSLWNKRPLLFLLILGFVVRMVSVIFSQGYGWHDDHFLVLEASQSWVDGFDYNNWLPKNSTGPSGHSFFYVGIHYLILYGMKAIGMIDPQTKMMFIRLLHALFSLLTVYFGFKIVQRFSDLKTARTAGVLLSLLWFMPFLSVRNLVEFVCIPPLMWGTWLLVKKKEDDLKLIFIAGLIFGIAFSVRYQTILFAVGVGLTYLITRKYKPLIYFTAGYFLCAVIFQGGIDYFVWGVPFNEFKEYVRYNIENAGNYGGIPWYNYIFLILGILLPPISFFLVFGFIKSFRKYLLITLPTAVFLFFHFYFQNRQERFILPAIPFLITAGILGWNDFVSHSVFWEKRKSLLKFCWMFAWILNFILIIPISLHYSHRERIEALLYLSKKPDVRGFLVEDSKSGDNIIFPRFYLGKWVYWGYNISESTDEAAYCKMIMDVPKGERPNYVLFLQQDEMDQRVNNFKKYFPELIYETTVQPSFLDKMLYKMNRHNRSAVCTIYRIPE